jgi:hypothetical protein
MVKQLCAIWFCAALLLVSGPETAAQTGSQQGWILHRAEGEIVLTRGGKRTVYQKDSPELQNTVLGLRDMVQTGIGTAELNLRDRTLTFDTTLRLSENTSVLIEKIQDEAVLELLYGRIRLLTGGSITIRTGTFMTSLKDCDAALDYMARPGVTRPSLVVQCYKGEGEITARSVPEAEGVKLFVKAGEGLSLEYQTPFVYVERKRLDIAAEPSPVPVPWEFPRAYYKRKNLFIAVGLCLIGAGAAMQGYSFIASPPEELQQRLFYGGYIPLGLGAAFIVAAAAYNPSAPPGSVDR